MPTHAPSALSPGFSDFTRHYLAGYRTKNGYGPPAAPATMRRKATSVRHLQEYFGNTPIASITPQGIADCMNAMGRHGSSMARADAAELKTIMRRAALPGSDGTTLIAFDPAAHVPLPPEQPSRQARKKPVSPAQEQQLYHWFCVHRPQWAILIPIACNVDLRPQDYLALKIGDIDPAGPTLDVVRSQSFVTGRGLMTKAPKTRASAQPRYLPRELMGLIEGHIRRFTDGRADSWLVSGPRGGMLGETLFYKWVREAGVAIGRPDLTPYVLRATADDRISRGHFGNMKEMLAAQGRSDVSTSIRHYQKLDADSMRTQIEQIWEKSHGAGAGGAVPGPSSADPPMTTPAAAYTTPSVPAGSSGNPSRLMSAVPTAATTETDVSPAAALPQPLAEELARLAHELKETERLLRLFHVME